MQFKRNFMTSLHNLSVKKTVKLDPPLQQPSLNSSQRSSRVDMSGHSSPYNPCEMSNDSRGSANKENLRDNRQSLGVGRVPPKDRNRMSPILSFHKVKQATIQQQRAQSRSRIPSNQYLFAPSDPPITTKRYHIPLSMPPNPAIVRSNSKSQIRLGSMVFNNISKQSVEKRQPLGSFVRESRSFDKCKTLKSEPNEDTGIQCLNRDGRCAKFKVVKSDYRDQDILYYCFNCAIPLVKQGFQVQQLNCQDKQRLSYGQKNYLSTSHFQSNSHYRSQSQLYNSRQSNKKAMIGNQRCKMGEQLKCKIIMKLNKLKASRQQYNKSVQNYLENIDYFYNTIISHIQQQRISDRQEIIRLKNMKKSEPQSYQSQLSTALGTVDYMIKNLQGINRQYLAEVGQIIDRQVQYGRIGGEGVSQGFQARFQSFMGFFDRNVKINIGEQGYSSRRSEQKESLQVGSALRFSFQENSQNPKMSRKQQNEVQSAWRQSSEIQGYKDSGSTWKDSQSTLKQSQSNWKDYQMNSGRMCPMNPLEQQSESQQSVQYDNRKNAFRNLFPEQQQEENWDKQSPVFKEF